MTTVAIELEPTATGATPRDALLEVRAVTKAFGGNRAVDDCSISVGRGTITGLIGPNGAGKSTLLNVIAGAMPADAGAIFLDGEPITGLRPDELLRRGLVRTFQVPRPIPTMTVLENLVLAGREQVGERIWNAWFRPGPVGREENAIVDQALGVLACVNLLPLRDAYAANLSGGQKKLLEFARTLMVTPRIVLLDEPAAGVNRTLMRQLAGYIEEQCRDHGVTFLIVEHDMDLVARLCDPVIVMAAGRRLSEGSFEQLRQDQTVLDAYLGSPGVMTAETAPALVAAEITSGYGEVPVVQDVSIEVGQDEIVTIIGPNGAGKSTLLKAIFGFLPLWQGRVTVAGEDMTGLAPERLACLGLAYVPQTDNIFPRLTIRENLAMGGITRADGVEERIAWLFELFPVLAERPRERAGRLSGGQRQTLALARALMLEPRVLLLDEPSASLSPQMVETVFANVVEINRRGTAVLMVEQRARQALTISDRGYVLANGRNRLAGPAQELLASDEVRRLYLGE